MAAAWGGYIFVLNMVAFHAAILVVTSFTSGVDSYLTNLHRAYSLFYVFGTYGAMQVPVIGWTPLKSMEQLFALFVFFILQMVEFCQILKRRWNLTPDQLHSLRKKVVVVTGALAVVAIAVILPTGYFGPLSSRVRGLFVRHTRTGNPLVDSVAEHQPASAGAYMQYLYLCYFLSPFGLAFLYYSTDIIRERREARIFLISYALVAYYFSSKMSRLILLLGPIASALCGLALTRIFDWCYFQITQLGIEFQTTGFVAVEENVNDNAEKDKETKKVTKARKVKEAPKNDVYDNAKHEATEGWKKMYNQPSGKSWRLGGAVLIVLLFPLLARNFFTYCLEIAKRMSNPTIMYYGTIGEKQVLVDDYREAYWWLRDNTAEDARVMAWWDYGYQIAGIANRTTIADGNTWNHEHIATLGRALTSPEKYAHAIIRHMADYVLIWTGGGGDDLAKSPHMARIANSVYSDICPDDPTCKQFGFTDAARNEPTPMMAESLLYKLHRHGIKKDVTIDENMWQLVFSSKYGKVRIYQVLNVSAKSKAWVADPANRVCDAPGSWYCTGRYPPAMDKLFTRKRDFQQLEDFNVKKDDKAQEYQEQYFKAFEKKAKAAPKK